MIRKAAVVLSTFLIFVSSHVFAVGLGNVYLDSSLNQPLRGRIEVLDLGTVSPGDISVQLASPEDFNRFNVDRDGFLLNLQLEIEETAAGVFVNITTTQPVREPFLTFILDTRWSSGRILSEHTVLLDLPAFDDNGNLQQPVNQPVTQAPEPAQGVTQPTTDTGQSQPATAVSSTSNPEPSAPEPQAAPVSAQPVAGIDATVTPIPGTIETQASDTLWEIALRTRPDDSVSVQQTMLAIQRLNPDAFVDGNINRLRAGAVLRVPDLSDIQSVNQQRAVSEVSRQNQQADVQPLAAPAVAPSSGTRDGQGRLSVVTAEDANDDQSSAGASASSDENLDSRLQALEAQLALSQESADRARIEQQDLLQRLDDLESQIASAMEIISLQDLQLAQLQESLAQAAESAQAAEPVVTVEAEPEPIPEQQGLWQRVSSFAANTSLLVVGAVVLVVLLLVLFLLRRSKSDVVNFDDEIEEIEEDDEFAAELDRSLAEEPAGELETDSSDLDDEVEQILGLDNGDSIAQVSESTEDQADTGIDEDLDLDVPHFDDEADIDLADNSELDEEESLIAVQEDEAETLELDDSESDISHFDNESEADDLAVSFDLADDTSELKAEEEPETFDDNNALDFDDAGDLSLEDDDAGDLSLEDDGDDNLEAADTVETDNEELATLDLDITDIKSTGTVKEPEPVKDDTSIDFENDTAMENDADATAVDFEIEDFDDEELVAESSEEKQDTEQADTEISRGLDFDLSDLGIDDMDDESNQESETIDLEEFAAADEEEEGIDIDASNAEKTDVEAQEVETIDMDDLDFLAAENDAIPDNDDEDFDLLSDDDEAATKLDLAYAYQKMGDIDGAREILEEVISEGNDAQISEAKNLLETIEK